MHTAGTQQTETEAGACRSRAHGPARASKWPPRFTHTCGKRPHPELCNACVTPMDVGHFSWVCCPLSPAACLVFFFKVPTRPTPPPEPHRKQHMGPEWPQTLQTARTLLSLPSPQEQGGLRTCGKLQLISSSVSTLTAPSKGFTFRLSRFALCKIDGCFSVLPNLILFSIVVRMTNCPGSSRTGGFPGCED